MATKIGTDHAEVIAVPSESDTRLWSSLNRVQQGIYRSMNAVMKKNGLPPLKWYDVLWGLERNSETGLRAFQVEQASLFEQSNLSRLLNKLIQEGLIEEFRCPSDGRGRIYKITTEGKALRMKMWRVYAPLIKENMSKLASYIPADEVIPGLCSIVEEELSGNK